MLGIVVAAGAVVLMLAARQRRGQSLLSPLEWLAVLAYVALTGLNGSRGSAIAVIITVLYFATRKKGALLRTAIGLGAVAAFAYAVLTYRSNPRGEQSELSALVMLLRDLGSVPFTTGATGQAVADSGPLWGSTIVAGLLRQIPGPVANLVFGQPDDTGAFRFRTMTGFNNDSNGYGLSIPAEGVMNFGAVGAFVLTLAFGVLLAWLYSRSSEKGSRGLHLAYVVAVASLPFGLRSDVLGAVKGALYPVLIISVVCLTARWLERQLQQRNEPNSGESATPAGPIPG